MAKLAIGACVAACAASLTLPALLGLGAIGIGGAASWLAGSINELLVCGLGALGLVVAVLLLARRKKAVPAQCDSTGACGCKPERLGASPEA